MHLSPQSSYPPSYYAATANPLIKTQPLHSDLSVETCIIGGGYAGLMTALGLIERGHTDIAIVEQHQVGWGASGRNGGFVFGGYSLGPSALIKQVGKEAAKSLYELTTSAVDLIRKRVADYQIECDLVDKGVIWANWFKDQSLLQRERELMQKQMGVQWQYLSPAELAHLIHSEQYHGGLFEPNAMHFHPLNFALGIAAEIVARGGKIFQNCQVSKLDYLQPLKKVVTGSGNIECKNLVIAGGGYLGNACPKVARSVLPIATYVMTTEPLGERLKDFINTPAAIYDTRFAFDYYRPLSDSRILWGGRISANTKTPNDLHAKLRGDLARVFPELSDVGIDYVWDGWMSYSRHQMAQIGALAPGVWYGSGFGGHGVGPTTAAGEILAAAITSNDQTWRRFEPWGLPWNGGVFGPMAAQASYWWYQAQDWLKEKLG